MSQPKESLIFEIGISGTFWDKVPKFSVYINDQCYVNGFAEASTKVYKFHADLDDDAEHSLEIKFENKSDSDVVESEDKSFIVKDMLLNIDSIVVDEIDIAELKWSLSEFIPLDPQRPVLTKCVNLGWNGSYKIKFTTPFYIWLLENM
jgi:hypothetical protein